jgi:hypothetical protein
MLTETALRKLLSYDPNTGQFTWIAYSARYTPGKIAGGSGKRYLGVRIDGKIHYLHRLVFLYMTGKMPEGQVDHINGDKKDNRWCNLRGCTPAENQQNRHRAAKSSKTGALGVCAGNGAFIAQGCKDGVRKHLGTFSTIEAARAARVEAGYA